MSWKGARHITEHGTLAKFHVFKHANAAVEETRRAEFFRKGGSWRSLIRGKRWLLLTRWHHLPREQLERLWHYTYEGAARRFLTTWLQALRWQRLPAFQTFAGTLLRHLWMGS